MTDVYNYDAFGNLIGRTGSTVNGYLFAGEQYDSNLGGYYLRQRYYDQYRGRFASQDPFEGWMSDPMSLHNYLYAHGNPVNAIDPSGLSTLSIGDQLNLIFAVGALAAIGWTTVNTVFTFKEGTPNEFPPAPPPFPIPRPSEPEILVNKPPADGFPPSLEPFPVPNPEKPEPLITRVPLLGLKEYLDNYVFQSGDLRRVVSGIAQRYKVGQCRECANAIQEYLISQGIQGTRINLTTTNSPYMYDDAQNRQITNNSYHDAISIIIEGEELVFDNFNPRGIPRAEWRNNIFTPGTLHEDTEPF